MRWFTTGLEVQNVGTKAKSRLDQLTTSSTCRVQCSSLRPFSCLKTDSLSAPIGEATRQQRRCKSMHDGLSAVPFGISGRPLDLRKRFWHYENANTYCLHGALYTVSHMHLSQVLREAVRHYRYFCVAPCAEKITAATSANQAVDTKQHPQEEEEFLHGSCLQSAPPS